MVRPVAIIDVEELRRIPLNRILIVAEARTLEDPHGDNLAVRPEAEAADVIFLHPHFERAADAVRLDGL